MSPLFLALAFAAALAFLGLALRPLLAAGEAVDERPRAAADTLKARLAEIDAAETAGLMAGAEAEEARLEARREALDAAPPDAGAAADRPSKALRLAAVAFVVAAPVAVALLYGAVGAPDADMRLAAAGQAAGDRASAPQPGGPPGPRAGAADLAAMDPEARAAAIGAMVDGLAARLEDNPDDPEGWRMLARSQLVLGRHAAARESYRRLFALEPGTTEDWIAAANAAIGAAPEGVFPADSDFLAVLDEIEARRPGDPFARFYRAGAAFQSGDPARAAEIWGALLAAMPAEAPGRSALAALIAEAEAAAGGAATDGAGAP